MLSLSDVVPLGIIECHAELIQSVQIFATAVIVEIIPRNRDHPNTRRIKHSEKQ